MKLSGKANKPVAEATLVLKGKNIRWNWPQEQTDFSPGQVAAKDLLAGQYVIDWHDHREDKQRRQTGVVSLGPHSGPTGHPRAAGTKLYGVSGRNGGCRERRDSSELPAY